MNTRHGYLCDALSDYLFDERLEIEEEDEHGNCTLVETPLGNAVGCCLRAACDVACEPSGGVLGWTAGDLRKMWLGRPVPKWVKAYFEVDFDAIPDDAGVWL